MSEYLHQNQYPNTQESPAIVSTAPNELDLDLLLLDSQPTFGNFDKNRPWGSALPQFDQLTRAAQRGLDRVYLIIGNTTHLLEQPKFTSIPGIDSIDPAVSCPEISTGWVKTAAMDLRVYADLTRNSPEKPRTEIYAVSESQLLKFPKDQVPAGHIILGDINGTSDVLVERADKRVGRNYIVEQDGFTKVRETGDKYADFEGETKDNTKTTVTWCGQLKTVDGVKIKLIPILKVDSQGRKTFSNDWAEVIIPPSECKFVSRILDRQPERVTTPPEITPTPTAPPVPTRTPTPAPGIPQAPPRLGGCPENTTPRKTTDLATGAPIMACDPN